MYLRFEGETPSRQPAGRRRYSLRRLAYCVHFFDFVLQAGCNQVPLELAVCRQQSVFDRERLGVDVESSYLFVVRQVRIDCVHGCLRLFPGDAPGHDQREISAAVAHQNCLLGAGQILQQLVFDGLGRDVVARTQDDQVLDAPDDTPVPCRVDFSLIAGSETIHRAATLAVSSGRFQ